MIDKERSRKEFLDVFTKNIEEAQKLSDSLAGGELVLVNHDCTLLLIGNATEVRFGHMVSKEAICLSDYAATGSVARRWNAHLSEEQVRAGCVVRQMFYLDALREYINVQRHLVTVISAA